MSVSLIQLQYYVKLPGSGMVCLLIGCDLRAYSHTGAILIFCAYTNQIFGTDLTKIIYCMNQIQSLMNFGRPKVCDIVQSGLRPALAGAI